jgi:hypothetical protein
VEVVNQLRCFFQVERCVLPCREGGVDASVRIAAADCVGRERPAFALDRLRERGPERMLYEDTKARPGGGGSRGLTSVELIDQVSALVRPSRFTATATST